MVNILHPESNISHDSAKTHLTGHSEYVDDRVEQKNELQVGVVYSPHARAQILQINTTSALAIKGVVCVLTASDVSHNNWGTIFQDQPFIAKNEVNFVGEVVAIIGAVNKNALQLAIKAVEVHYEVLNPILSIDEAIKRKSFIGFERTIQRGENLTEELKCAHHKLSGTLVIRGAEHFYLENQSSVVYPKENNELEVHSSSQHPTETQHLVAEACGIKFSDVTCIVKRLGGAFGGKESQAAPFAAYAALVAHKTKRPARIVLSKDDDMIITGKRNPFQIQYEVGFNHEGRILALNAFFYSDGGAYADLSPAIMERAMLHADNAYYIPNIKVSGQVCKTNFHPHTAFRGFGAPKGVALIESIIEDIAHTLNIDSLNIRKLNCYGPEKNITHYQQTFNNNMLPSLFTKLEHDSRYRERRTEIAEWNSHYNNSLRGLSLTAVKFGISFTTRHLNQGNAFIILHLDGTAQVSTGAVEMGQGVNTRIAALVAEQLGLHISSVRMMPTATDKNANTSPTAASSGTDINGAAAVKAAEKVKYRLAAVFLRLAEIPREKWASKTAGLGTMPEIEVTNDVDISKVLFKEERVFLVHNPQFSLSFAELLTEAYLNRLSLSEYAFYSIPNLGFNKLEGKGQAFLYFTQGVAASEVEIDRYTGEVKVKQVDILMDLGRTVNYHLDIGQISGAFVQGMGWMTTENLLYSKEGLLLSHSPSTYKIPSIQDTPRLFNINLIENNDNTVNVRGTKAVGEPPLVLAISVWTAIKDALYQHNKKIIQLQIPATNELILKNIDDKLFAHLEAL